MTTLSVSRFVGVSLLLGAVAACSSVGETTVSQPLSESIRPGASVAVMVEPSMQNPSAHAVEASTRLSSELKQRLVSENIFKSVGNARTAKYRMTVKVNKVKIIHPALRATLGFFPPRSNVDVTVELRKRQSNQIVTAFQVSGSGARNNLSGQGYGMDDPIRKVVDNVVAHLRR